MSRARITLHYSVVLFCKKRQNLLLLSLKCKSIEEVATLHGDSTSLVGPVPHCCGKHWDIVLFSVFIKCDILKTFKCIISPFALHCIFDQCAKKTWVSL